MASTFANNITFANKQKNYKNGSKNNQKSFQNVPKQIDEMKSSAIVAFQQM